MEHMKRILLVVLMATALGSSGLVWGTDMDTAVNSVNACALDIFGKLKEPEENLFFSPYSLSAALAMAYAGARERTASQMSMALHFSPDREKLLLSFGTLNSTVAAASQGGVVELNIANVLWGQAGYGFRKEFLELLVQSHNSPLRDVDFQSSPGIAASRINQWASEETRGRITHIIDDKGIGPLTKLIITNAVYFKGTWASKFNNEVTKDEDFTLHDGTRVRVPMMRQLKKFLYMEGDEFQVLELPYEGNELSMVVILPREDTALRKFEEKLTVHDLEKWLADLSLRKVRVYLPSFEMTDRLSLKPVLSALGMTDAFTSGADFSGMIEKKDLFIDGVLQKTFVKVKEEGTEAAAVTAIVHFTCRMGLGPKPPPVIVFRADHPFLFLIRHRASGCILFMGRVANPKG